MKKLEFEKKTRKAVETESTRIVKITFLNNNYHLDLPEKSIVNRENGLLEMGKLTSKDKTFRFRWDEKAGKIDIDLFEKNQKKPKKNFEGHHTELINNSTPRKYNFKIKHKEELIFKGVIATKIKTENIISRQLCYKIAKKK